MPINATEPPSDKVLALLKMMTRPGEQFVIRRKAYAAIMTVFDANGIKFAFPTVQVAGGTEASVAAAAQNMLNAGKVAAIATGDRDGR